MKILSFAWTIYDSRIPAFCNDCTGGGLVIKNLCEEIGKYAESYLFIGKSELPEMQLGNIRIVGTNNFEQVKSDEKVPEELEQEEIHLQKMTAAFASAIEHIAPDIVNFHGIGVLMYRCIKICIKQKIPYAYTEHLYIGGQFPHLDNYTRVWTWEKDVYSIPGIKVIAVSTGMKHKILKDFPDIPNHDISVILNGTDFYPEYLCSDFHAKYKLNDKKVLLCVGTILERKNQIQIIRAFQLLPDHIAAGIKIIFCGKDCLHGAFQKEILCADLQDQLIYVGAVSSNEMKKYYSIADGLIMPSLAEGLSIAALEAISYGLPVIMFADSECADDLNDQKTVCFAQERSNQSLAAAIAQWYTKTWDRDYIMQYAQSFSLEKMGRDYMNYYKRHLAKRTNMEVQNGYKG